MAKILSSYFIINQIEVLPKVKYGRYHDIQRLEIAMPPTKAYKVNNNFTLLKSMVPGKS